MLIEAALTSGLGTRTCPIACTPTPPTLPERSGGPNGNNARINEEHHPDQQRYCTLPLLDPPRNPPGTPIFLPPMDIPIELSGNFMELRSDHFHSGLDMKTQGREGFPVKAAGRRLGQPDKISPWGYGKAVYVDHPNGYTTVYGHLSSLAGAVAEAALDGQYKARNFDVDLTFERGRLPVTAGQVMAYSGNTGGSSAPHLHFEVRRTSDQHALDPEAYGMEVPDNVPPVIIGRPHRPAGHRRPATSPYPTGAEGFPVVAKNDTTYTLKDGLNPAAFGTVGLSVNTIDRYSNSSNQCGIRLLRGERGRHAGLQRPPGRGRLRPAALCRCLHGLRAVQGQRHELQPLLQAAEQQAGALRERGRPRPHHRGARQGPCGAGEGHRRQRQPQHLHLRAAWGHGRRGQGLAGGTPSGELFRYDKENVLTREDLRFTLPPNALYADERLTYIHSAPAPSAPWPRYTTCTTR